MNIGAGVASGVGAIIGLFAGSLVGKAIGGKDMELVGAALGGTALGAFTGTILTAPDANTTTTTPPGTSGLPKGLGAASHAWWATVGLPAAPATTWSAATFQAWLKKNNLPASTVTATGPQVQRFMSLWNKILAAYEASSAPSAVSTDTVSPSPNNSGWAKLEGYGNLMYQRGVALKMYAPSVPMTTIGATGTSGLADGVGITPGGERSSQVTVWWPGELGMDPTQLWTTGQWETWLRGHQLPVLAQNYNEKWLAGAGNLAAMAMQSFNGMPSAGWQNYMHAAGSSWLGRAIRYLHAAASLAGTKSKTYALYVQVYNASNAATARFAGPKVEVVTSGLAPAQQYIP
jgi:hypothetical protein